ncbi:hypothetical protein FB45DRAFT_999012 [Roridomyces roridus]|uniref:Uncharacterized protein n=1 Tax=Roridomyces roridus TaxID=1738132 RepID=A0AAD7CAH2_9AGAR|nr:hypothetical protein FB45DRAFT_999012 [Roridomyces roridus]
MSIRSDYQDDNDGCVIVNVRKSWQVFAWGKTTPRMEGHDCNDIIAAPGVQMVPKDEGEEVEAGTKAPDDPNGDVVGRARRKESGLGKTSAPVTVLELVFVCGTSTPAPNRLSKRCCREMWSKSGEMLQYTQHGQKGRRRRRRCEKRVYQQLARHPPPEKSHEREGEGDVYPMQLVPSVSGSTIEGRRSLRKKSAGGWEHSHLIWSRWRPLEASAGEKEE